MKTKIDTQELLKIIVCPICKSKCIIEENNIICSKCKKTYPIIDAYGNAANVNCQIIGMTVTKKEFVEIQFMVLIKQNLLYERFLIIHLQLSQDFQQLNYYISRNQEININCRLRLVVVLDQQVIT